MRKKLIILLMCVSSAAILLAGPTSYTLSLESGQIVTSVPTNPIELSIEQTSEGINVEYTLKYVDVRADDLFTGCKILHIEGFGTDNQPGHPALPLRNDLFNIPKDSNVELIISSIESREFSYNIGPARQSFPDNTYNFYTTENITPINSYVGFFPESHIELIDRHAQLDCDLQYVRINPIKYDINNNKVQILTKINYQLKIVTPELYTESTKQSQRPSSWDNVVMNPSSIFPVANTNSLDSKHDISRDYLIVTTPSLIDAATRLREWKRMMGFNVHIVTNDNWTYESVKAEISNQFNSFPNLSHLLIIGDLSHVPGKACRYSDNYYNISYYSDLYYGCMGNGYIPSIKRGRIPVYNLEQANNVINKIIEYESSPPSTSEFYQTAITCTYFQDLDYDMYEDVRYAKTTEEISEYLSLQGKDINRIYSAESNVTPCYWSNYYSEGGLVPTNLRKPQFSWTGNTEDISTAINNGVFLAFHRDHGSESSWYKPSFTTSDISRLNNGRKLPVVFSINCSTGNISTNTSSFAEQFLQKENGGCAAIIAASETTFSGLNEPFSLGMIDAIWPSPGLRTLMPNFVYYNNIVKATPEPTYEIGQILDQGLIRMNEVLSGNLIEYTFGVYHCYGDPSMKIYTETPSPFSNISISRQTNVNVNTDDPESLITFYDTKSDKVVSYKSNSAQYNTTDPYSIDVSITKHNKIPYIDRASSHIMRIQNTNISNSVSINSEKVIIGSNVDSSKAIGPVRFTSNYPQITTEEIIIYPDTYIEGNAIVTTNLK